MNVKVSFFALERKAVGKDELVVELDEGTTVSGLLDILTGRYPRLEKYARCATISLNSTCTSRNTVLQDGDEVAIIPPVAGGSLTLADNLMG